MTISRLHLSIINCLFIWPSGLCGNSTTKLSELLIKKKEKGKERERLYRYSRFVTYVESSHRICASVSKFTDVTLVPRESVDVKDGTSDLDDGPGTDSRASILLLRRSTRVRPRDSREAVRDNFEHSVGISSVVKYR